MLLFKMPFGVAYGGRRLKLHLSEMPIGEYLLLLCRHLYYKSQGTICFSSYEAGVGMTKVFAVCAFHDCDYTAVNLENHGKKVANLTEIKSATIKIAYFFVL